MLTIAAPTAVARRTKVGRLARWRGEGVAAVVLAGGIGRRFGTDKARARIAGTRLLDRALAATADFAPVWVAAGTPERAATLKPLVPRHVRVVPDDRPGRGRSAGSPPRCGSPASAGSRSWRSTCRSSTASGGGS
jgi:hypothetical protein